MALFKRCLKVFFLLLLAGACGGTKLPPAPSSAASLSEDEPQIRARFTQFQKALEEHHAERLWAMLSNKTQTDAERAARTLRAEYQKADAATKERLAKELGLSASELTQLTGRDLVKTKAFHKRYAEVREGKYDRADVQGDNATVHFHDEEGDQEKVIMLREEGQWKLWLKLPTIRRREP
jgi:hypothetical protein